MNSHSEDASVSQGFAEVAYTGINLGAVAIDPYLGFTWARVKTDGATEKAGVESFKMKDIEDDIQIATLGARFTAPFTMGDNACRSEGESWMVALLRRH